EELKLFKKLYYQLHNLEKFPEVLPGAKAFLLSLLKEASAAAYELSEYENILSIPSFSRQELEKFLRRRDNSIGRDWEAYNLRRNEGEPRELFGDREEAISWLKQIAPVKYVDGAWLGHIGKVTTPFALRKTMKGAWQILSEELGDGDLEKNHVHVYYKLLETIAPGFPTAESVDFGHTRDGPDNLIVWKAAIAQLLVSLFPAEFLPEILGFNLHFEAISMDTLKAGKELKEVGIDPYYFILHVSIDNASSGHSAIAIELVCEYMDYILKSEGEEASKNAWKKLQAGYLLSLGLPGTTVCPSKRRQMEDSDVFLSPTETEVMRIFKAKAQVVHGIHCNSRVKIGSRSVADWLDPVALESTRWQRDLLDALSFSKYWIVRGDSGKSRFIQELQWNGRMFGAFAQDEYDVLKRWIDSLPNTSLVLEFPDTRPNTDENDDDILSGHPVFRFGSSANFSDASISSHYVTTLFFFQNLPSLDIGNHPVIESFLPLWFSHPCLLQGFVSVPFRTKNNFACTIIKILRAQGGFDIEQECVAGMGEVRRPNSLGLIGIGLNMMAHHGLSVDALPSLKHLIQAWPSKFAVHMLHISMRPIEYNGLLIGMATAFAKMHVAIARSPFPLLSAHDQKTLQKIAQRELENLGLCWKDLEPNKKAYSKCSEGYLIARSEIEKCF
ncbi:hypothetical protein N431DRAFT_319796, partial [Stipitochalara longipes BDJ]